MIKQRVSEAVDKVKRQYTDEKQRLVLEANAKLRDAVSNARSELEGRMTQTHAIAVQEALKEANAQSSSKEVCTCVYTPSLFEKRTHFAFSINCT